MEPVGYQGSVRVSDLVVDWPIRYVCLLQQIVNEVRDLDFGDVGVHRQSSRKKDLGGSATCNGFGAGTSSFYPLGSSLSKKKRC